MLFNIEVDFSVFDFSFMFEFFLKFDFDLFLSGENEWEIILLILVDFLFLVLYFENDYFDFRICWVKMRLDYLSIFDFYLEVEEDYVENYLKLFFVVEKEEVKVEM